MKTALGRTLKRSLTATSLACLMAILAFLVWPKSRADAGSSSLASEAPFHSLTAQAARQVGSPVAPPRKVILCHKGRSTLSVNEKAVAAHLRHGDYLGPCQNNVAICHKGKTTLLIPQSEVQRHLNHGDQLGVCSGSVILCTTDGFTIIVPVGDQSKFPGATVGPCPPRTTD
jgi:hypothetical protein